MSPIEQAIQKIPRPLLVVVVLVGALAVIISQNPMKDGCEPEVDGFTRQVRGVLVGYKTKSSKTQFAQINTYRDLCKEGNSAGACENYFRALKKIADGLVLVEDKCLPKLLEEYEGLVVNLSQGIKIMALTAWGAEPPSGVATRLGWLSEGDIYTFCRLKNKLIELTTAEDFKALRSSVYREYPDKWPDGTEADKKIEEVGEDQAPIIVRPKALRTRENPSGPLEEKDVFERSLFSIRCDMYQ